MRYLLCLVGGALFGALLAMTAAGALQRRHAWPRAIMVVMQHELGEARENARRDRCPEATMRDARTHLAVLSNDLERALLAGDAKDRVFGKYAQDLRASVAAWNPAATCPLQAESLSRIAQDCDACHRDYR